MCLLFLYLETIFTVMLCQALIILACVFVCVWNILEYLRNFVYVVFGIHKQTACVQFYIYICAMYVL